MNLQDAQSMARTLMDAHRCSGVRFRWNNRTASAGRCLWGRDGSVWIELSRPITRVNDADVVRDTILHEIAHAHVGCQAGHGPAWVNACLAIGGSARPCKTFGEHGVKPPDTGWVGTCAQCGGVNHIRTLPTRRRSCSKCAPGAFSEAHVITWEHQRTHVRATHKARPGSWFNHLDNTFGKG